MSQSPQKNPLHEKRTRNNYIKATSFKIFIATIGLLFLFTLSGCFNEQIVLPTFMEPNYKQTDIINQENIREAISLYSRDKIDKLSFNMAVQDFELMFKRQMSHLKSITPQFYLEMNYELLKIFNLTDSFSPVKIDESNFLKLTLLGLSSFMLDGMSFPNKSEVMKDYYKALKVQFKDYDFEYSLSLVDSIAKSIDLMREQVITMEDLRSVKETLSTVSSSFKKREIKIGLRETLSRLEETIFLIDKRLLEIDLLKKEITNSRGVFVGDDSSYDLVQSIRKVKSTFWLSPLDYPYILGDGFVEVMPTETFSVKQYGKIIGKNYVFESRSFMYKRKQSTWVDGTYELKDGSMFMKVGRYTTEFEVFRITNNAYLLGSEILFRE